MQVLLGCETTEELHELLTVDLLVVILVEAAYHGLEVALGEVIHQLVDDLKGIILTQVASVLRIQLLEQWLHSVLSVKVYNMCY